MSSVFWWSCRTKKTDAALAVLPDSKNKTYNIIISDSAATETHGVRYKNIYFTPDRSILENISLSSDFFTFRKLVALSKYKEVLESSGPFTVFLPTNTYLAKIQNQVNQAESDAGKANNLLAHHIVIGNLLSSDLVDDAVMLSIESDRLNISHQRDNIRINGIPIKTQDIVCRNGTIHILEGVLTPNK